MTIETRWRELATRVQRAPLNLTRGRPPQANIDMVRSQLETVLTRAGTRKTNDGFDIDNYGGSILGVPEMRRVCAGFLGTPVENTIAFGSSCLDLLYHILTYFALRGVPIRNKPGAFHQRWAELPECRFLVPWPCYDRHPSLLRRLGPNVVLVPIPMTESGPDMDVVESEVRDTRVKGMIVVPKYHNFLGLTFSDEVMTRLLSLQPAAADFVLLFDNAYAQHDLTETPDVLLNPFHHYTDRPFWTVTAGSFAKVTRGGSGVGFAAMDQDLVTWFDQATNPWIVSIDKRAQVEHALFLDPQGEFAFVDPNSNDDLRGWPAVMRAHRRILFPTFNAVWHRLEQESIVPGIGDWRRRNGGYFIAIKTRNGKARQVVQECASAGLTLTPPDGCHPSGMNPDDNYLRFAPSAASVDEADQAAELLALALLKD